MLPAALVLSHFGWTSVLLLVDGTRAWFEDEDLEEHIVDMVLPPPLPNSDEEEKLDGGGASSGNAGGDANGGNGTSSDVHGGGDVNSGDGASGGAHGGSHGSGSEGYDGTFDYEDDGGETSFFQEEEVIDYNTPIWDYLAFN
mmetsp:Transcript_25007/g.56731  ORF Transcript_25007/g.56731 Transcript_25007/m.56731 type:complete len:142 (-) Transcript_25007:82-507(-)